MAASEEKQDKHFPLFAHDNPIRRLFVPPQRLIGPYVTNGQVVADLGCGPGYYTLALSVDFVLANGLLYSMASQHHEPAVNKIHNLTHAKDRIEYLCSSIKS